MLSYTIKLKTDSVLPSKSRIITETTEEVTFDDNFEIIGYTIRTVDEISDIFVNTKALAVKIAVNKNLQGKRTVVFTDDNYSFFNKVFPVRKWHGDTFRGNKRSYQCIHM